MWPIALVAILACAQGRAVNISNTWVLPEEGFSVFYRYFRDRISWYEADAVCQFHHANLVTVDTTAQYDAVRAYLKELDISNAVWVGLIRSNSDGDFTWTDYRGLSGDGYWSAAPDARAAPLCAAADPSADYRWEARACGGPTVASFICELPVPQWALGAEGCMVRALPDLTVLYLPESAAVQLTTDCGLDGVKRVLCTGSVKHEEILKNLSCAEEAETEPEETFTSINANISISSTPWTTATETSYSELETTKSQITTKHLIVTVDDVKNLFSSEAPITAGVNIHEVQNKSIFAMYEDKNGNLLNFEHNPLTNTTVLNKNLKLDLNNYNIQDNDVPKQMTGNDLSMSDNIDKLEDEQHMQHKILHDELARHGNFETIFSQPSDHFVPPLVMAKAKISDDMTVLSFEQKHAQQIAEQHNAKYKNRITELNSEIQNENRNAQSVKSENVENLDILETTTKFSKFTEDKSLSKNVVGMQKDTAKDKLDIKANKTSSPKKFKANEYAIKDKNAKRNETVTKKRNEKHIENDSVPEFKSRTVREKMRKEMNNTSDPDDDVSIDLKVIIKTADEIETYIMNNKTTSNIPNTNFLNHTDTKNKMNESDPSTSGKYNDKTLPNGSDVYSQQVIKITVANASQGMTPPTFETTTKMTPESLNTSDSSNDMNMSPSTLSPVMFTEESFKTTMNSKKVFQQSINTEHNFKVENTSTIKVNATNITEIFSTVFPLIFTETPSTEKMSLDYLKMNRLSTANSKNSTEAQILSKDVDTDNTKNLLTNNSFAEVNINNTNDLDLGHYNATNPNDILNGTSNFEFSTPYASETTEDFRSPLLSGANDPVSKPNRSRRPPIPPNRNKFNPFRILG